jgi:hypothetical protein
MRLFILPLLLLFTLTACFPGARTPSQILDTPAADAVEQTANLAYHRMEIGKLETGVYNTNVLGDLALPQGVLWTLESLSEDSYQLRFSSSQVEGFSWLVTPQGVSLVPS